MKVLYISGPFSHVPEGMDPIHGIEHNINEASRYALMAAREGWAPFTPHKNTSGFQHAKDISYEFWMQVCLTFVQRADAVLMIPGWEQSKGAIRERDLAISLDIPVFYYERDGGIPSTKTIMRHEIAELLAAEGKTATGILQEIRQMRGKC